MFNKAGFVIGDKIMNRIFLLGLLLLCFAIYFNSLNNPFVLDDDGLIVNNPIIKSFKFLPLIFEKSLYSYPMAGREVTFNKMFRPLQLLTYSVDYKVWKLNPMGFHLTNILLHLFNSILIYYLLLIVSKNNILSKTVSILFLVHPIHTSVVSYIAGRADILVCFFMLLSIIGFLQFIKLKLKAFYILSLLSALLALLSRENALLLFLFIALILFIIKTEPKYYLYIIPFIFLDFFYLFLRFFSLGQNALALHASFISLPLRIVNFFNIIPRYLFILLLPLDLHLLRTTSFIMDLSDIRTFFVTIFILLYFVVISRVRKNKLLLFSMLWFLIGITPVFIYLDGYSALNGAMMAESWLYIPSIGFFVIFITCQNILKRLRKILLVSSIIFYSFLTVVNNAYWKSNITLYKQTLEYTSEKNPLRKELIKTYLQYGLYDSALTEIKKFSIYYPNSPELYNFWGNYYFFTGQVNRAIDNYKRALNKDNKFFYASYNLSLCYEKLKQLDTAMNYALECLKINPYYSPNLVQLGDLYAEKKQFIEAKKYYQMALELDPDNQLIQSNIKDAK